MTITLRKLLDEYYSLDELKDTLKSIGEPYSAKKDVLIDRIIQTWTEHNKDLRELLGFMSTEYLVLFCESYSLDSQGSPEVLRRRIAKSGIVEPLGSQKIHSSMVSDFPVEKPRTVKDPTTASEPQTRRSSSFRHNLKFIISAIAAISAIVAILANGPNALDTLNSFFSQLGGATSCSRDTTPGLEPSNPEINAGEEYLTRKGFDSLWMGKNDDALKYFNTVLKKNSTSFQALGGKGQALHHLDSDTSAEKCLDEAASIKLISQPVLYGFSEFYLDRRNYTGAIYYSELGITHFKEDLGFYKVAASAYIAEKDVTGNMTYCDNALNRSLTAVNSMENNKKEYPSLKDYDEDVYDSARLSYLCVGNQQEADKYSGKISDVRLARG